MGKIKEALAKMRFALCLALVACAAALPLGQEDNIHLGEEAASKSPVAQAVEQVHREALHELSAQWAKEAANSHWHCKHCHSECKTHHCHRMCSDRYCSSNYAFKKGRMDMLTVDGPVTPAYAKAIHDANLALEAIKTAKTDKEFEIAEMALQRAQAAAHADREAYRNKAKMADQMDKAAYGTSRERQAEEDKTYLMEKAALRSEQERAKSATMASERDAGKNAAYVQAGDTVAETKSFDKGTSMLSAVDAANDAEKDALKSMGNTGKSAAAETSVADVAEVAAEMERVGVKAAAAASEATDAAGQ